MVFDNFVVNVGAVDGLATNYTIEFWTHERSWSYTENLLDKNKCLACRVEWHFDALVNNGRISTKLSSIIYCVLSLRNLTFLPINLKNVWKIDPFLVILCISKNFFPTF